MGIFSKKKKRASQSTHAVARVATEAVFDEEYKENLRRLGQAYFKKMMDKQIDDMSHATQKLINTVSADMKSRASAQLDMMMSRINKAMSDQLNQQMTSYQKTADQASELATQSINRSTQAAHAKYQQMVTDMQRTIAEQETMMVGVFQDNKSKVIELQAQQDKAIKDLHTITLETRQQADAVRATAGAVIRDQQAKFSEIYNGNLAQLEQARSVQAKSLNTLAVSAEALEKQHQMLKQLMDAALAKQKALITSVINQHMSRIVEYYLIETLGDNSDIVAQLPSILEKLNDKKQAMQEDMKL